MSDDASRRPLSREEGLAELVAELRQLREKPPELCDDVDLANIEYLEKLIQTRILDRRPPTPPRRDSAGCPSSGS